MSKVCTFTARSLLDVVLAVLVALFAHSAYAGTQVLDVEIGVSTVEQLKRTLSGKTKLEATGTNKYSEGPMFKTNGDAHEIEGLSGVLYIFDAQSTLAGVVLTMSKYRFDAVYQALRKKYKVASEQLPFVGDKFARFNTPDAVIEATAPHMSFEMEVNYLRTDLRQKFLAQSAKEADDKKKREAAKF